MKNFYICAIIPEQEGNYSVYFPDIPNCFTTGNNVEDALLMAEDVLAMMLQDMAENRKDIPAPSNMEAVKVATQAHRKEAGLPTPEATVYQYIAAPSLNTVPVRVSVSFSKSTLEAIDQKASAYGFTRSGFLAKAAEQYHA